jgi:hypothetical protein
VPPTPQCFTVSFSPDAIATVSAELVQIHIYKIDLQEVNRSIDLEIPRVHVGEI